MSNKKVSVGFDIGTSGVKCVAFDHCSGQTNSVYLEYPLLTPHPGYAEFDCNTIWQRILHSFILLRNKYGIEGSNIVSIGFCALCPGLIALGDDGCELGNCIIFMDARSGKQTEFINKTLPFDKSFEIVGNRIMSGATSITTIMWLKENRPDIYEKTKYFVHLPAWAGYKCTGEVRMDLSNASGTGLYDVHEQNWSRQISDTFAIDPAKLPPLAEAVDLLGGVTNAELISLGIREGTPVSCGAGDTVSALLAMGINKERAMLSLGTSHVLYTVTDKDTFHPSLMARSFVYKNMWAVGGAMSNPGAMLRWFRDNFCQDLIQSAHEQGKDAYSLIDEEAALSRTGADGLICLPYINGERSPVYDSDARAVFFGVSLSTNRAAVSRSIMEGAAFGIRQMLEIMEGVNGSAFEDIYVTGGGSKSDFLVQIMADITCRRMSVVHMPDTGAMGAAFTGAIAGGILDTNSLPDIVRVKSIYYPNEQNCDVYGKLFDKYVRLYPSIKELFPL